MTAASATARWPGPGPVTDMAGLSIRGLHALAGAA